MTSIISIILLIFNFLNSIGKKHYKEIALLLLFFIWLLYWGSIDNPDFSTYTEMYNSNAEYITSSLEIGFILLIKFGNILNLSYQMFLLLVSCLCFFLIHITIKRYTKNYSMVYALYFVYPVFLDIIQIRNFIATSILIYSTKYLLEKKQISFVLLIILASTFQTIALVYLPLVFINKRNLIIRVAILISLLFSTVTFLNNRYIPFLDLLLKLVDVEKISLYTDSKTNFGFLVFWGLQLLSCLMMFITKKINRSYNNKILNNRNDNIDFVSLVYWINNVMVIYFPLYLLNSNFFRISRNVLILNYICFAITNDKINNKQTKFTYICLIIIYITIYFMLTIFPEWQRIVSPILNNNYYIN